LATSNQPHNRGGVDLAKSQHFKRLPGALREDALRVMVTRDGRFYWGNEGVGPEALPGRIREGIGDGAEKRVYILADARGRYADVKTVLDQIRVAGVERVSFLTFPAPPRQPGSEHISPDVNQPAGVSQ